MASKDIAQEDYRSTMTFILISKCLAINSNRENGLGLLVGNKSGIKRSGNPPE
jgi:hypothetical protein